MNGVFEFQTVDGEFVFETQDEAVTEESAQHVLGISGFTPYLNSRFAPVFYTYANNTDYLLDESTGALYQIAESIANDDGTPLIMQVRTGAEDGGENINKFCSSLEIIGDKVADTAYVSYSDNDFQSFGFYRPVNLAADRCQLRRCGKFRRRAHSIIYYGAFPLRLYSLEMTVDKGAQ